MRDNAWWDAVTGIEARPGAEPPGFLAVYEEPDGTPAGFAHYGVAQHWESRRPASILLLKDLVSVTGPAYDGLWRLVTSTDLIAHITAPDRPALEPLRALIEDRRHVQDAERNDFLWARLVDVPAALASRRYGVDDRIVLEVTDAFRPASGGRVALDAGVSGATCRRTSEPPDLTLAQADLGACYLGSAPLWPAVAAGRVTEHRPGAAAAFDRLFALGAQERPAWCHTWF
jgi:predicted acetyltransferase